MAININLKIQKKDVWLIAAIIVFLVGVGYVIAYNSGASPSIMGHSIEELENVQQRIVGTCASGNSIRVINSDGSVTCEADTDTDTDTRCDTSGRCSQVCIGNDCKSTWGAAICTWGGTTYSTGARCNPTIYCNVNTGNDVVICESDGSWTYTTGGYPCPSQC